MEPPAVPPAAAVPGSLLALRGVTKTFPGIIANDHVDLDLYSGEVLALLGENGAGKSTLMKVLYGFYRADAGEIWLRGRPVRIRSPHDARRLGIGMVFQTFTLIPALSVLENIALFLPALPAVLDQTQIARRMEEMSARYGLSVDPWAPVRQLSIGEQQKVEILKLLLADAKILILDEPTRVLAPHEIEALFEVFASLRRDRYAVVFITHKLQEVLVCADRITVMRRGRIAGTITRAEATERGLVSLMFGTVPPVIRPRHADESRGAVEPLLELRQVDTRGAGASVSLGAIDLSLLPGEIGWKSEATFGSLASDFLTIAPFGPAVPPVAVRQVNAAKQAFVAGQLNAFQGPIKDNRGAERVATGQILGPADIGRMDWLAEGVIGQPR